MVFMLYIKIKALSVEHSIRRSKGLSFNSLLSFSSLSLPDINASSIGVLLITGASAMALPMRLAAFAVPCIKRERKELLGELFELVVAVCVKYTPIYDVLFNF